MSLQPPSIITGETILIVDFGSQVTQLIARRVREAGVYCEIAPFNAADEAFERLKPRGIILSGGPSSVMWDDSPRAPQHFFDCGLPILAICRGMQAINVARGGTLYQHLPDRAGTECQHRQAGPGERVTHSVEVEPATKLARILGKRRMLRVNSFHHQSVRRLGSGLHVVAFAPDGVVEGIEAPGRPFLVGVQWHAECLVARRPQMALFEAFVAAARGHSATLAERAASGPMSPAPQRVRRVA